MEPYYKYYPTVTEGGGSTEPKPFRLRELSALGCDRTAACYPQLYLQSLATQDYELLEPNVAGSVGTVDFNHGLLTLNPNP